MGVVDDVVAFGIVSLPGNAWFGTRGLTFWAFAGSF
jgi:hypothetical protein